MIRLDIWCYLIIVVVIKLSDKIKYLISEKMVLQIVLIIILQESELIYMIFNLLKKY